MTSCSLQLSGGAQTVLAADDCRREPHDYAGSSFFGRRGPHPEMEHGRTVLAGVATVGRGRIAAFTDSTVWSSFAVFSFDREKLAMDLVRMLNREPSPYELPIRCAAGVARVRAACRRFADGALGRWLCRRCSSGSPDSGSEPCGIRGSPSIDLRVA